MDIINPYKGLFQYTSKDEAYFFGREKETIDLMEMIKNNQLVILYGESGTGKTSLINAKLFPELKRKYYFPIYIRLNFLNNVDPLIQLRDIIYKELSAWDKSIPKFTDDLSLIDYASNTSIFNGLVNPILFFDQFEELFTLGQKYVRPAIIEKFLDQISDLIEVRLPELDNKTQSNINSTGEKKISNKEIYTENVLKYTVVLSMRQDYIAQLDDLRFKIPSIVFNRYRLKKFNDEQAKDAIIKPAKVYVQNKLNQTSNYDILDNDIANEIIIQLKKIESKKFDIIPEPTLTMFQIIKKFLFSKFKIFNSSQEKSEIAVREKQQFYNIEIDPTILSLYCLQLYKEGAVGLQGLKKITQIQVKQSPCDKIIENYYNESLSSTQIRKETEAQLITPDGRRTLVLLENFISKSGIDVKVIEKLKENTGVFRIYGEGKERELEIAHDQLAKRALINKREREANKIKLKALFFSLVFLVIIIVLFIGANIYIDQQKKSYTVISLRETLQKSNIEKDTLESKVDKLSTYNNLIEKKVKYLQSNLEVQTIETNNLKLNVKELSSKYYLSIKALSQLQIENRKDNNTNQLMNYKDELKDINNKYYQSLQDLNKAITSNKMLNDSLDKYKIINSQLQRDIIKLEKMDKYGPEKKQYKK